MINIEAGPEGFTLLAGGRRVLSHSRRSPCLELGRSENSARLSRGSYKFRRRRASDVAPKAYRIVESSPELAVIDFEGRLALAARWEEGRLRLAFSGYDPAVNHFRIRLAAWPDEAIFGCGERFDRLDLKLSRVPLWVRERGGGGATPFPVPAFVSSKDYWCAIDCSAYLSITFRRAATVVDSWAVPREIVMGFRDDASSAVADMGAALGRPPAPPQWAFEGACLGVQGGAAALERKLDAVLRAGAKVSSVFVRDWRDPSLYPDLPGTIASLRARGLRFLGYAEPLLRPGTALYEEASGFGYCVKGADGKDCLLLSARGEASPSEAGPGAAAYLDLSNDEALSWMKGVISQELIGIGMSGWMADCGEAPPPEAVLASGERASCAHNSWPLAWARLNREAAEESGRQGELLFFLRSGWLGSPRYAGSFWAADRREGFSKGDGLAGLVPAALSLGLSGGGFWHSDTGGTLYSAGSRRSPECLGRWMEMSAFTPLLRGSEGNRPEASAQFWSDRASLALFARMSSVFASLKPYHLAVAREQAEGGLPPIRHPWMHYEADPRALRLCLQYLYGRDLMVAPALAPRLALTELYLPEDEWVHLWTSRRFRGGQVAVESPLGCPAVFYRADSAFASLFDALRRSAAKRG